jgi:hypothetical protein
LQVKAEVKILVDELSNKGSDLTVSRIHNAEYG